MSRLSRIALVVISSFMFLIISFGYAALTDSLSISGSLEAEGKPFVGVYIYSVEVYQTNGVSSNACEFAHPTNIYSSVNASSGGRITYKITFHNNSAVNYWFVKQEFVEELENNILINEVNGVTITPKDHPADNTDTFNAEDWIPPGTYRDVYVTYSFGASASGSVVTFVNYLFGMKMDSVHGSFLEVLNSTEPGGGYDLLTQAFNKKYAEEGSVVLANVGEEKAIFDTLFGGDVTINIDGVDVPVTMVIRRENVDGKNTGDSYSGNNTPSGCEYTIYLTIDPLDSPTGKAIVFAVSYSRGGINGVNEWYQVGELYEGTANRTEYESGVNAFDYTSWIASPKEYVVANGVTYLVGQEQGDQYDKLKKLEEIISTQDQDIFNFIDSSQILKNVYAIVYNSQNVEKPGYDVLRKAFLDAAPFYNVWNNGGTVQVNRNYTRAEIIPYIEAIQKAYDYYNEVN